MKSTHIPSIPYVSARAVVDRPMVAHHIIKPGLAILKINPPATRLLWKLESVLISERLVLLVWKNKIVPMAISVKPPNKDVNNKNLGLDKKFWTPSIIAVIIRNSTRICPDMVLSPANLLVFNVLEIVNSVNGPGIIAPVIPRENPVINNRSKYML